MVNMQVVVQRAAEVARVQNDIQQQGVTRQAEFAQKIQEQTARMANTATELNQPEKAHVQEKQEKERQEKGKKKNRSSNAQNKKQDDANATLTQTTTNRIDITI
jgi:hypothetical protein